MPNDQGVARSSAGIVVDGLAKRFGETTAVDGVSFTVAPGEVVGLLGPNGAGKTTLISILSTLLVPDGGSASVAGHDVVAEPREVRESIALTGQFAALDQGLTGRENLVLFARLRGLGRDAAAQRATELLERFGLVADGWRPVSTYSGGMRRRLDLAASLVADVPVLFLDEPTTGLDPRSRGELWEVVRDLRAQGLTVVLTTQYLEEADRLADRVVVIDHGRLVATGTPDELKRRAGGQSCVVAPAEVERLSDVAAVLGDIGEVGVDEEAGTAVLMDAVPHVLAEIVRRLDARGIALADVSLRRPSLDEVFLQLTGGPPERAPSGPAASGAGGPT